MTKFTKRAAAVLTASLMLAGVVSGCGNNANNETPSTGSDNEGTKVYKIVADNSFAPFDFMDPRHHGIYRHRYGLARCYRRGSGL